MAGNQELFQALQMFQQGVQQAATTSAVNDATQAMQDIHTNIADQAQQRQALDQLSRQTALRLVGTGANGTQIQSAFQAVAPQQYTSPEQMQMQAQLTGNTQLGQQASSLIQQEDSRKKGILSFQEGLAEKRDQLKFARDFQLEAMKAGRKGAGAGIPGFIKVDPNVELGPAELKDLRKSVATVGAVARDIGQLEMLVNKHGTEAFSAFSNTSSKMGSLHEGILLKMKEFENLGVLQKQDIEALSIMIPDPTAFTASGTKWKDQMSVFKENLASRITSNAETNGYKVDPNLFQKLGLQDTQASQENTATAGAAGPWQVKRGPNGQPVKFRRLPNGQVEVE